MKKFIISILSCSLFLLMFPIISYGDDAVNAISAESQALSHLEDKTYVDPSLLGTKIEVKSGISPQNEFISKQKIKL